MDQNVLNRRLGDYLKALRLKAQLSQGEVAARSDVFGLGTVLDQKAVSRLESNPINTDAIKIAGYLSAIGVPIDSFYKYIESLATYDPSYMKESGEDVSKRLESYMLCLQKAIEYLNEGKSCSTGTGNFFLKQYLSAINTRYPKPIIGFFGQFEAGKSALINAVLNKPLLPENYGPTTSIVALIVHESDRPSFFKERVGIFRQGFMPYMIHNKAMFNQYHIASGGLELLDDWGIYDEDGNNKVEAFVAVIFDNSPMLLNVTLIDSPGNLINLDVDRRSLELEYQMFQYASQVSDGCVFVSPIRNFLNNNDLGLLLQLMRKHNPLSSSDPFSRFLLVASHCHSQYKENLIEKMTNHSLIETKRLFQEFVYQPWLNVGSVATITELNYPSTRVLPFWRENKDFCSDIITAIETMSVTLSNALSTANHEEYCYCVEMTRTILQNSTTNKRTHSRLSDVEKLGQDTLHTCLEKLLADIEVWRKKDLKAVHESLTKCSTQAAITGVLESYFENKASAIAYLGDVLGQQLTTELESIVSVGNKHMLNALTKLLQAICDNDIQSYLLNQLVVIREQSSTGLSSLSFDDMVRTVVGSMYINKGLACDVVYETLSSKEIHKEVVITHSVSLGISTMMGLMLVTGTSWVTSISKKLVTSIRSARLEKDLTQFIDDFWDGWRTILLDWRDTNFNLEIKTESKPKKIIDEEVEQDLNELVLNALTHATN